MKIIALHVFDLKLKLVIANTTLPLLLPVCETTIVVISRFEFEFFRMEKKKKYRRSGIFIIFDAI